MKVGKLDRPPYVHNWVRYNAPDVEATTRLLVQFAKNVPQITYGAGLKLAHDRFAFGLERSTALMAAATRGHEKSRPHVVEFVRAFYDFDETARYSGLKNFDQFVEPFRVSKDVVIPVKPLVVLAENGVLRPIFVVGWATMPLTDFQRRLLMTIVEDAVFSLTDFRSSPGEFISFPKDSTQRRPLIWRRGDFNLLSEADLKEQLQIYLQALQRAKLEVFDGESPSAKRRERAETSDDPAQASFVKLLTKGD